MLFQTRVFIWVLCTFLGFSSFAFSALPPRKTYIFRKSWTDPKGSDLALSVYVYRGEGKAADFLYSTMLPVSPVQNITAVETNTGPLFWILGGHGSLYKWDGRGPMIPVNGVHNVQAMGADGEKLLTVFENGVTTLFSPSGFQKLWENDPPRLRFRGIQKYLSEKDVDHYLILEMNSLSMVSHSNNRKIERTAFFDFGNFIFGKAFISSNAHDTVVVYNDDHKKRALEIFRVKSLHDKTYFSHEKSIRLPEKAPILDLIDIDSYGTLWLRIDDDYLSLDLRNPEKLKMEAEGFFDLTTLTGKTPPHNAIIDYPSARHRCNEKLR